MPETPSVRRVVCLVATLLGLVLPAGCGSSGGPGTAARTTVAGRTAPAPHVPAPQPHGPGYRVPPLLDRHDVYAADRAGMLSPVVRDFPIQLAGTGLETDKGRALPSTARAGQGGTGRRG